MVIETATDNNTRTVANVRSVFNKFGGALGTSGSLSFLFDHKCVFKVTAASVADAEELELELIDCGADEVFAEEDSIIIYGTFESYHKIQSYLDEHSIEIVSGEFVRIPVDTKEVTDEQRETLNKMIERFEEDDDVTNVYTNMKEEEEE
jgi:transcriptional/translational regulatory protein YebC/TACO1